MPKTNLTTGFSEPEHQGLPTHKHERLESWLGVYRQESMVLECQTPAQVMDAQEYDATAIGKNHSYNRSALDAVTIRLGSQFDYVRMEDGNLVCGGAVTIEKAMRYASEYGRRLVNSGNYRKQTIVGACIGGTHGFGTDATMMDSVIESTWEDRVCLEMTLRTEPETSFRITHCVCPLSFLNGQTNRARSYAVLPFSGRDPICIVSEYEPWDSADSIAPHNREHSSWWRIKIVRAIQALQREMPFLNRWAQKLLNFAKMRDWVSYTAVKDIDALYHPWPDVDRDGAEGHVLYHSQRPSHQYHNLAFACLPEDTERAINEVRKFSAKKLAGFIGVRELTSKSGYGKALNYDGPRNAVDVYFYLNKHSAKNAEALQKHLTESELDLRWHPSKST